MLRWHGKYQFESIWLSKILFMLLLHNVAHFSCTEARCYCKSSYIYHIPVNKLTYRKMQDKQIRTKYMYYEIKSVKRKKGILTVKILSKHNGPIWTMIRMNWWKSNNWWIDQYVYMYIRRLIDPLNDLLIYLPEYPPTHSATHQPPIHPFWITC